ncbi:hypothetical protein ANN_21194 [Periplaneta americana]|uniref:Uncharacterized protein n=1 Tax=Periplaneta americana TaxID=6978 RepID=A0ABQ8SFK5_PERAM|nr:hypothetical protein ANN_21194 [Periplaneta americana]
MQSYGDVKNRHVSYELERASPKVNVCVYEMKVVRRLIFDDCVSTDSKTTPLSSSPSCSYIDDSVRRIYLYKLRGENVIVLRATVTCNVHSTYGGRRTPEGQGNSQVVSFVQIYFKLKACGPPNLVCQIRTPVDPSGICVEQRQCLLYMFPWRYSASSYDERVVERRKISPAPGFEPGFSALRADALSTKPHRIPIAVSDRILSV